jgi:hypothetical protein
VISGTEIKLDFLSPGTTRLVHAAGSAVRGGRDVHGDRLEHERRDDQHPATSSGRRALRATGVYTIKNLGIVSTIFRAQRCIGEYFMAEVSSKRKRCSCGRMIAVREVVTFSCRD